MSFKPGDPKPPTSGRKPGVPNRARDNTCAALSKIVEGEMQLLGAYMKRLRDQEATLYLDTLFRLIPYTVPRGGLAELAAPLDPLLALPEQSPQKALPAPDPSLTGDDDQTLSLLDSSELSPVEAPASST